MLNLRFFIFNLNLQSMYQYNSDSEHEQDFNIEKLSQSQQPHIKEVLQKAKKILPTYDNDTLLRLYKRYYLVDSIFFNELSIIAHRAKQNQVENNIKKGQDEWITIGKEIKAPKFNKIQYNFLQDKQLLKRAQKFIKNKSLLPQREQYYVKDSKKSSKNSNNNNQIRNYQSNYNKNNNQKNKYKYIQKKNDNKIQIIQQQPIKTQITKKLDSPIKQIKYKEKYQTLPQNKTQTKKEQKKNYQELPKTQIKPQNTKINEPSKKQQQKKQAPITNLSPVQKITEPVALKPTDYKPAQKEQSPQVLTQKPASQPIKLESLATHNIPTVQNFDESKAEQTFAQSCKQNSFVLKFIKPQAYPQRISYIRTADGGMKNVQIRVSGTSQKAL